MAFSVLSYKLFIFILFDWVKVNARCKLIITLAIKQTTDFL